MIYYALRLCGSWLSALIKSYNLGALVHIYIPASYQTYHSFTKDFLRFFNLSPHYVHFSSAPFTRACASTLVEYYTFDSERRRSIRM